jgi:hypothetical protein
MLHEACNMTRTGNIPNMVVHSLERVLPAHWRVRLKEDSQLDACVEVRTADAQTVRLLLEVKRTIEPRDVEAIARQVEDKQHHGRRRGVAVVVSPFLTRRTRELLEEAGLSYLDLTGNCRIVSETPGMFISTPGAETNPKTGEKKERSLKGPVAGRVVRALCDYRPPVGVRALASRATADPGYVSRVASYLEREALIIRRGRGTIEDVHWRPLLQRWAQDYSPFTTETMRQYLDPRGVGGFTSRLRTLGKRYALTSSWSAAVIAPVAPPRLVTCYVDDPEQVASALSLRPADAGINVRLVVPFDPVVYERTWERDDLTHVALPQAAADLLNSPGRGPEEATALLEWMEEHQDDWRA